jgi:hypothetical protein
MKWISVKDELPKAGIIVAIMGGRQEWGNDPIEDATIVILRNEHDGGEWRTMDSTEIFYLPHQNRDYYNTIKYWIPWTEFKFPDSMVLSISTLDKYFK